MLSDDQNGGEVQDQYSAPQKEEIPFHQEMIDQAYEPDTRDQQTTPQQNQSQEDDALHGDQPLGQEEDDRGNSANATDPKEERTCFVGNIGCKFNDEDLYKIFSVIAKPESARVARHLDGRSKGVAFVTFPTKEDADAAVKYFSTEKVDGRLFHIKPANAPKSPQKNGRGVYNAGPSYYSRSSYYDSYDRRSDRYDRGYYRDEPRYSSYDRDYDRYRRDDRYYRDDRDRRYDRYDDREYSRRYDDRRRYDDYDSRDRRDSRYYGSSYGSSGYGYDMYGSSSSMLDPSMTVYGNVPLGNIGSTGYTAQDLQSVYMMGGLGSNDSKSSVGYSGN